MLWDRQKKKKAEIVSLQNFCLLKTVEVFVLNVSG